MSATARKLATLLLLALVVFLSSLTEMSDWDTFHHMAYGRDVLRRGGFAAEDPFLYPVAGRASGPQPSWLGSVVIYLSWRVAGDPGPVYLTGLLGVALFVALFIDALDGDWSLGSVAVSLLPLSFALAVFRERAVARPELFSNVLLAVTIIALRRYAGGRGALLLSFPAVAVLWVNLHHSVLVGVVTLLLFPLVNGVLLLGKRIGIGLRSEVEGPRALVVVALVTVGGLLAAAVLNPGGVWPVLASFDFVLSVFGRSVGVGDASAAELAGFLSRMIDELRPPTAFQWSGPFGWLVALCAASFAWTWRRLNVRELAMCAVFAYLAASAQRFMVTAAIVAAPMAARNLRMASAWAPVVRSKVLRSCVIGCCAVGLALGVWRAWHIPDIRFGTGLARQVPARAVQYLKSIDFDGRLYNSFHFGGFLEWTLDTRVFQDGRGLLLPEDARAAYAGPSSYAQFDLLDRKYRFDALVVHYPQFAGAAFSSWAASPRGTDWGADRRKWGLVAFDDGGQVYLRRDGAYAALLARDEFRHALPTNSLALPQASDPTLLRQDLERSLREAPDCLRCRTMLGYLQNELGKPDDATAMLLPALDGLMETRMYALMGLAQAAESRGDLLTAASRWREIASAAPDPTWARRRLAELLLRAGRLDEAMAAIQKNLGSSPQDPEDLELGVRISQARGDGASVGDLSGRLQRLRAVSQARQLYDAGVGLMRAGRQSQAIDALRRSLELNERAPDPHFAIAQAYEAWGDGSRAAEEYRRYLEIEPAGAWASLARERLGKLAGH